VVAFPLQVLVLVVAQLGNNVEEVGTSSGWGAYACTNFIHGSTPFRCNFARLLHNSVEGAFIFDFFSMGLGFILATFAAAILLMALRILHQRLRSRPNTSLGRTREE